MRKQNTTNTFLKKLIEKDKEKANELYMSTNKNKENVNNYSNAKSSFSKAKLGPFESIATLTKQANSQKNWYLDVRAFQNQECPSIVGQWLNTSHGHVQFKRIFKKNEWEEQISQRISQAQLFDQGNRKCFLIEIWCLGQNNFSEILLNYSLHFLKYGKGTWSLAAINHNKRYDLLSLDAQGSQLWKGKTPLSKIQLQREQLMKRVFGFGSQKQKAIGPHQTLAKLQLSNNNLIYFVLRNAQTPIIASNAHLLITQQMTIQDITNAYSFSILRSQKSHFEQNESFIKSLEYLKLIPKKQEQLSKRDRERFLKNMIESLQNELQGKQQQLLLYKSQQKNVNEEQFAIPSERVSMGQQRYQQLKRQIKQQSKYQS